MLIKKYNWEIINRILYIISGSIGSMLVVLIYSKEYYYTIVKPLIKIMKEGYLIYTNILEIIISYILLSTIIGIIVGIILIIYNIYDFVRMGLYKYQVDYMKKIIKIGIGITLIYWVVIEKILREIYKYLEGYGKGFEETEMYLSFEPKVSEYLGIYIKISIILYIISIIPIILMILNKMKIITWEQLLKNRLVVYIGVILGIIIIVPPDLIIHIIIYTIIIISYEIMLLGGSIKEKYKKRLKS